MSLPINQIIQDGGNPIQARPPEKDCQKLSNAELWMEEFRYTLDFMMNKARQDTLAEMRKEVVNIRQLVNPHERWSEKTGKKREREKQLYQGFNEARDKIIKILLARISEYGKKNI